MHTCEHRAENAEGRRKEDWGNKLASNNFSRCQSTINLNICWFRRLLFFALWYSTRCCIAETSRAMWKLEMLDFEFNWRTVENRKNPQELFRTKTQGMQFSSRAFGRKIISVGLATTDTSSGKNWKIYALNSRKSHVRWLLSKCL